MITSNINELIFQSNIKKDEEDNTSTNKFIDNIKTNSNEATLNKNTSFTFENIKGITLDEIDRVFKSQEDKDMAKNLRLATLFSNDKNLSQAMFNTILGEPFQVGHSFLSNSYEDKNVFLNSKSNNLSDLLHKSITNRIDNKDIKTNDVIPQEHLDEILLEINSFSFLDAMSNTYHDQYDKYKDEDNDYSFLYNDFSLKYEELKYKYEELENKNRNIISQF